MRELHLDYETYSAADLPKVGAHRYAQDPSFMILIAAWAFDDEPVQCWDYTEGPMPNELIDAIVDPNVIKFAHNAAFELACTAAHFGSAAPQVLDFTEWRCTSVWAASLGLPRSLDALTKHLKVSEKDPEGKRLINYFSKPISSGKRKGERRLPEEHPEDWAKYRSYCMDDVEAERTAHRKLAKRPMQPEEWELWALDQRINFAGLRVDTPLAENAVQLDAVQVERRAAQLVELTGLENPNSVAQLSDWLDAQGYGLENLRKETVEAWLANSHATDADDEYVPNYPRVREVLSLRLENANKSTSKYEAMLRTVGEGDRVRGLFQFYGADTGRWAGRLVQVQNLPRNYVEGEELDALRARLVIADDTLTSGDLKQLIRTAFIPSPGHEFLVSDFSAIEARVLAWLAGESWALEAFATHGKIYEATAAAMLNKSIDEVTKDDRQRGKVSVLALGYQGSTGALINMGALDMGLKESELPRIVAQWRGANKNIVQFWAKVERAAKIPSASSGVRQVGPISFEKSKAGTLYITLPSGRQLAYPGAKLTGDAQGRERLSYWNFAKGFREDTYGGKLTENIVQAVARDLLAHALLSLDMLGYRIVAHVHDEVVSEMPVGGRVEDLNAVMVAAPAWAAGLPLAAEGEAMRYYHK